MSYPDRDFVASASSSGQSQTARGVHVLLVSDNADWSLSVHEVVAAEGGVVETVSARAAIVRLAGAGSHLSHVLVDYNDADGLLGALADLMSDTASAGTELLLLGGPDAAATASLADVSLGDLPRGDVPLGDVRRADGVRGDVPPADGATGDDARGDVPRDDAPPSGISYGKVPREKLPKGERPGAGPSIAGGPQPGLPNAGTPFAGVRTVPVADRLALAGSLTARSTPVRRNEPTLPPIELLEVVKKEMIETRYQPIVRLADRSISAVEVLARLNHPVHGTLTPDWFVPRFEDAGLSFSLTDLVSTRAFADLTGPHFAGLGIPIALNYPLKVLSHPKAAESLDERCKSLGLSPGQVQIELTESRPVEDFVALGRSLEHLRSLGYRISIDDVGPAVKNLDRLLTLPFTGLKLDKGIVRLIGTSGPGAAEAPRVIAQARRRGMNVIAEGIETREGWDRLLALGVQEVQGYFVAAIRVWVEAWRAAV
jgi:EAL domain-containing protein (putative c-di-GMP-specific phosphodiesterase class I)